MSINTTIKILEELWRCSRTDKYTDDEIREALIGSIEALKQISKADETVEAIYGTVIIEGYSDVIDIIKEVVFDGKI